MQNIDHNVGIQHISVQTYRTMWKYNMINQYVTWNIELGNKKGGESVCCHLQPNDKYIKNR